MAASTSAPWGKCFGNDLIAYTISHFLPGEYLLRVFPFICKATQSLQLSLSLLGPSTAPLAHRDSMIPMRLPQECELEGPMYGISSTWRDIERIAMRGHSITALRLEAKTQTDVKNITRVISCIRRYPQLTKLEIDLGHSVGNCLRLQLVDKELLLQVWSLPLISLTIKRFRLLDDVAQKVMKHGPPAFAQTLRTLHSADAPHRKFGHLPSTDPLLDILSPHCTSLQDIGSDRYHSAIMTNNPNLTSLTLYTPSHNAEWVPVILTPHTQLIKLTIINRCQNIPLLSMAMHSSLEQLFIRGVDPKQTCGFLQRCPGLKHLSLADCKWESIVQIISTLNPTICRQLTLTYSASSQLPSFTQVAKEILHRGFSLNEEALRLTNDAPEHWTPSSKKLRRLVGNWPNEILFQPGPVFRRVFHDLTMVDIHSVVWSPGMLRCVLASCIVLKELAVQEIGDGVQLELQSQSLSKLHLRVKAEILVTRLTFPNLTHLSLKLRHGEGMLVEAILDGNPLFHLPRLSVMSVDVFWEYDWRPGTPSYEPVAIDCKVGHQSLTQLTLNGSDSHRLEISTITLQNLPSLRQIVLEGLRSSVQVLLNLPGDCDIKISNDHDYLESIGPYIHKGYLDQSNSVIAICFDWKQNRWIEKK